MKRLEELRQRFQREGEEQQRILDARLLEWQRRLQSQVDGMQEQSNRIVAAAVAFASERREFEREVDAALARIEKIRKAGK